MTALEASLVDRLASQLNGSGKSIETIDPATGEVIASIRQSTAEDVAQAFKIARAAQPTWAARKVRDRVAPFLRFSDKALSNQELMDVIQAETGKSRNSAFEETVDVAAGSLYFARKAPEFLEPRGRVGALPVATKAREYRHPKGVIGVIAPWNYPVALSVGDAVPALLAGNAVVIKPDSQTVLSVLYARELLIDSGVPEDLIQVVVGDPADIGDAFIGEVDHVWFTGSSASGRRVAEAAGRRLIGCTLELGGKNPMIVLEDADLDKAVKGGVRACFSNTGQLCMSAERIYIAESIFDEFAERFVETTRKLRLGKGRGFDYDIGTLTVPRVLVTVTAHVEDARGKGAKVLTGGNARPDLGPLFYQPTVLTGVTPAMRVYREETFGPVVSLYPIRDDEHAIELANDSEYGLNASVWTRNEARGFRLAKRIQAGTVNINEGYGSAYASHDAPSGGMKTSGQGRRHGEHGILEFTELQTIASQRIIGFDPPPGLNTEQNAKVLTAIVKALKTLHIK